MSNVSDAGIAGRALGRFAYKRVGADRHRGGGVLSLSDAAKLLAQLQELNEPILSKLSRFSLGVINSVLAPIVKIVNSLKNAIRPFISQNSTPREAAKLNAGSS
jgi:hypothetical protein